MKTIESASLKLVNNEIKVSGILSFQTVAALRSESDQLFGQLSELTFDFQDVTRCDSAALALLAVWMRKAQQRNKKIKFIHLPTQLYDIAKLSGLDKILPIENA